MFNSSSSSSSSPYSSSLPSNTNNNYFYHQSNNNYFFAPSSSSPTSYTSSDFLDFHSQPVRRVFSMGDLQWTPSTENCGQEGVGIGGRVGRYTAEERMKRIERYQSKRNKRNFQKKITYACRKTLADSRPRVRGRFARNDETETEAEAEAEVEAETLASDNSYRSYNHNSNHENCDNGGSSNNDELWRQLESALGPTDEEEESPYVEDMWASFESVFSMNLLS